MLQAISIPRLADLQHFQNLPERADYEWLLADVTLGGWRSYSVARECYSQLGLPLVLSGFSTASQQDLKGNFSYADIIGKGIDAEAKGNLTLLSAYELAEGLFDVLEQQASTYAIVVLAPRFNLSWAYEDQMFIYALQQVLRESRHQLIIGFCDQQSENVPLDQPLQWLFKADTNISKGENTASNASLEPFSLLPGIIEPAVYNHLSKDADFKQLSSLYKLNESDCRLVPPEARVDPNQVNKFDYDRLCTQVTPFPWLVLYSRFYGNNHYVQPMESAQMAWQHYQEGAGELALKIIDRVAPCGKDPTQRAILQCQSQGMRVSLHQFSAVAEVADPVASIPEPVRNFLLQAKGWGLVFSNQPKQAMEYFLQAQQNISQENLLEYLYFLNIKALTEARSGNVENALQLELEIERHHQEYPTTDQMLAYVNALNTARLYRWKNSHQQAAEYYQKAFATTAGLRSDTDLFFINATEAMLAENCQQPHQAVAHWLCAALHWLASHYPEAVGFRAIKILVKEPERLMPDQLLQQSANAIEKRLIQNIEQAQFPAYSVALKQHQHYKSNPTDVSVPVISRLNSERDTVLSAAGFDGGSLFVLEHNHEPIYRQNSATDLRHLLWQLFRQLAPCSALDEAKALAVDNNFGHDIAKDKNALITTAIRLNLDIVQYQQHQYHFSAAERERLQQNLWLSRSDAIDHLQWEQEVLVAHFKRYRTPYSLNSGEAELMSAIEFPLTLAQLAKKLNLTVGDRTLYSRVREMENQRLLQMELMDD